MASWGVYNSRLSALCALTSMFIRRAVGSVANASFTTTVAMVVGDTVAFRAYVGPTTYITVLTGSVISCKQNAQRMYECQAVENNDDLRYYQAEYNGSRIINIDNSGHTLAIKDYVAKIIGGTGWTDGTLDTSVYIPNTTDYLPSIRISSSYVSSALDKFLKNTCGYDIWYNSTTKKIYYGEYRVDRTGTSISPLYSEHTTSDIQHNATRVIVYGATNSIFGVKIKTGATPPYRTLMYQYADAADATECEKIATQILNDRQYTLDRYESTFNIATLFDAMPNEGDKVHVESSDVSLDDDKGVKDVTFSLVNVVLGLGYSAVTIFDILGDKLMMMGGSSETGTELTWDGGWQHVDVDATTGPAIWKIAIDDLDLIGDDFTLELHLHKWVKDLSTLPSLAGMIADGHISGVSADRALAGLNAAKQISGVATIHTITGVSADKSLSGISIDLMNAPSEMVLGVKASGGAITNINSTSYQEIGSVDMGSIPSDGRHVSIVNIVFHVAQTTANWVQWYVKIQDGEGYVFTFGIPLNIPPQTGGYTTYIPIPVVIQLPFDLSMTGKTLYIYVAKVNSGDSNLQILRYDARYYVLGRHIHDVTEPNTNTGHEHNIEEPDITYGHEHDIEEPNTNTGHDHDLEEPNTNTGHDTSVDDPLHDHDLEEPNGNTGHDTNEDDTKTEVDSFPEDVDIYVNDVKINTTPFPGGVDETIEQIIPKTAFIEGENTIMVKSTAKGSVYAFGLYTQYGSG